MNTPAPWSARLLILVASLPALAQAYSGADAANWAVCREQALAEGLRSEEVILDYIVHECLLARNDSEQPSAGPADSAKTTLRAPPASRQGSPARLN